MKPKGVAKHHQTLCSWVESGDETRKRIDLDHVKLFHLIVWKLYESRFMQNVSTLVIPLFPSQTLNL